jgi:hypothetical protein
LASRFPARAASRLVSVVMLRMPRLHRGCGPWSGEPCSCFVCNGSDG